MVPGVFPVAVAIAVVSALVPSSAAEEEVRLLVTTNGPSSAYLDEAAALGVRVTYAYSIVDGFAGLATPSVARALEQASWVVRVEPDGVTRAVNDVARAALRAPEAWNLGYDGKGVTVAVIDTGIDTDNPDFAGRIAAGVQFVGGVAAPVFEDDAGHGTHVAGSVGGSGAAAAGRTRGVAPGVQYVSVKTLNAVGVGLVSDTIAGLDWIRAHGRELNVRVATMSLGAGCGVCDGSSLLSVAADALWNAGYVVTVAAGNSGPGGQSILSPGDARKVITVGAVDDAGTASIGDDVVASFSSRGPTWDGRVKPDVVAPGVRIESSSIFWPLEKSTVLSGTSMATPMVAGAAAILLSKNPAATPDQVKSALLGSARRLPLDLEPRPNNNYGWGIVDVVGALARV